MTNNGVMPVVSLGIGMVVVDERESLLGVACGTMAKMG
jgi:hypothetical protein